jgi:hypothetical protein
MIGMVKLWPLAALLVVGCDASLGGGNSTTTDADTSMRDGGGGKMDAALDAPPACANGRKLFLEFLGVTLSDDANSDATTNKARWLTTTSSVIPPWRQGGANRAVEIQQVVDGVKARLANTPIEVVTTRPAAGPYVMVVLGGATTGRGGTVGTVYAYATSYHDCGDVTKNDVGWVSDMTVAAAGMDAPTTYVADLVVGSVGWGLGLDGTTDGNDCMCAWTTSCTDNATACTLATTITSAVTNPGAGETACKSGTQNEVAAFSTEFCQ